MATSNQTQTQRSREAEEYGRKALQHIRQTLSGTYPGLEQDGTDKVYRWARCAARAAFRDVAGLE